MKYFLRRIKYGLAPSIYWARTDIPNWGDDLNPWLYYKLTGKKPIYCPHLSIPKLFMAGSILHLCGPKDSCWGSGYLEDPPEELVTPNHVYAVRGKLTAKILESRGAPTTSNFGDPGCIVPRLIEVDFTKKYKIALVPHYVDWEIAESFCKEKHIKLVPVSLGTAAFVQELAGAEMVYSSSLHGIICAESLGIPTGWVRFSDNLIGGSFKFHDYLSGTGREYEGCQPIDFRKDPHNRLNQVNLPQLPPETLSEIQLNLIKSFPFKLKDSITAQFTE